MRRKIEAKISPHLRELLLGKDNGVRVGLTVRLTPVHDLDTLIVAGLAVKSKVRRVVIGSARLCSIPNLAALPFVEHLEARQLL